MDPGISSQEMIEHGWQPCPVKRILLELPKFRYLFGNTRHMPLYRSTHASSPQNRVALLGFGDPRNAWSTAAAAVDAGCKQLQIDLVDIVLANVARGVLLEYLSTHSELNVSENEEDAMFLWLTMYSSTMPPAWFARLQSFINELLSDGNKKLFMSYFGRASDADKVKQVLQSWAKPAPSAAEIKEKRRRHVAVWLSRKINEGSSTLETANDIDPKWEACLEAMAAQIVIAFEVDSKISKSETDALKKLAQEECHTYLKTGTIYPKDIPSMVEVPESDWVGNPTLLEPGSGGWYVHYGAAPFLSYLPMTYSQSNGKVAKERTKSKSFKPMTESCFAEFRALASGRRRAGASTKMRFFLGDAVKLCSNGVLEHGVYSTVDTSNIADNIGLLNTLVTCQPLLLPDPQAVLYTTSMTWGITSADSLIDYFDISLGVNLQLTPTLLGLRLLNPPEFGRATPRSILTSVTSDVFLWQPVVPTLATGGNLPSTSNSTGAIAPLPRLIGSPELLKGLQSMVQICTKAQSSVNSGRCGADAGTTLTVLHLLRGLYERVEGVLPSHEAEKCNWEAVASHTASVCKIPEDLRKQWDALVCWCFGELGSSIFTGKKNVPVLLSWKVDPSSDFKLELKDGRYTSMLQADLAVASGQRTIYSDDVYNSNTSSAMKKDRLDVVGFDCATLQAQCLLPPNLNISEMTEKRGGVILSDTGHGMRRPLSSLHIHPLDEMEITPLAVRPPLRLAASNWVAATRRAAEASAISQQIKLIKATESAEKYHFSFEILQPEGNSAKKAPVPSVTVELPEAGKVTVWGEDVSRQAILKINNPTVSVALAFSSAISSKDLKPRLIKKKAENDPQRFEIDFSKSSFWPGDEVMSQKIKVEGLPTAGLHELDLGKMFSLAEGAHKLLSTGQGPPTGRNMPSVLGKFKGGVLFDAKETIQSIFTLSLHHGNGKNMMFTLHDPESKKPSEASLIVFVHGIFKLPDGRPIAHISCVDQDVAYRLYPTEQQKMPALRRCQKMMQLAGGRTVKTSCAAGEVDLFRKIFKRNSASLVVPKGQKKLLEGAPEWIPTYLTLLYSDSIVEASMLNADPNISSTLASIAAGQMGSQATGAARAASSSSSAGTSSARSCVVCGIHNSKLCSRCKKTYFCSPECQKSAWPEHKKVCKAP